jgi:putative PIG3 family NAD(P)H quinone oxidoreductase
MSAIVISQPGGPRVLKLQERPIPRAGPGEVLIEVTHAGVNRPDMLQREGRYPPPPGASDLPGLEIAGRIAAVGEELDKAIVGKPVCALVPGGGYAGFCLAREEHCLPVPETLSMAEAAAMPETLFTVWHNVFQRGAARDGETLLVHGGTSGIGTMAIKLARLFDMEVIATCGSDEKCDAARRIGANHAINYRTSDFVEEVRSVTSGRGADVALDMVAGEYTQRNLDCVAEDGRLVTIAVLGGARAEVNMAKLMVRRQTITGSTLRTRSNAFKAALAHDIAQNAWPFVEEGALRPEIDRVFALADAAKAHERMESGDHIGKLVLEVGGPR